MVRGERDSIPSQMNTLIAKVRIRQKKVRHPLAVESGRCKHDVDGVSEETLDAVFAQAVV